MEESGRQRKIESKKENVTSKQKMASEEISRQEKLPNRIVILLLSISAYIKFSTF